MPLPGICICVPSASLFLGMFAWDPMALGRPTGWRFYMYVSKAVVLRPCDASLGLRTKKEISCAQIFVADYQAVSCGPCAGVKRGRPSTWTAEADPGSRQGKSKPNLSQFLRYNPSRVCRCRGSWCLTDQTKRFLALVGAKIHVDSTCQFGQGADQTLEFRAIDQRCADAHPRAQPWSFWCKPLPPQLR